MSTGPFCGTCYSSVSGCIRCEREAVLTRVVKEIKEHAAFLSVGPARDALFEMAAFFADRLPEIMAAEDAERL